VVGAWISSLRKVLIATATFAVGAAAKLFPTLTIEAYVGLGALIFVLVGIEEFFTSIRPAARLASAAPAAMDGMSAPILKILLDKNIPARMSLFTTVRSVRSLWFRRYFKVRWTSNMEDQVDSNISFPVACGVSGQCFGDGKPRLVNSTGIAQFPLPPKIADKVKGLNLEAVFCVAVFEREKRKLQSGKRIGVINLDSLDTRAYAEIEAKRNEITAQMRRLARLAALIYD
jgi:hypothetical protein